MTNTLPTLDVLIVTHAPEGIGRVAAMNPPRLDGVNYIVSWQNHGDSPVPDSLLGRDDFRIYRFDGKGVSANRNNALDHSTADIMLIADDDLIYSPENLLTVRRVMAENPEVDYASFMYDGPDRKQYPDRVTDISVVPENFYQTTFEIALRADTAAGSLRFNPLFGPGAPVLTAAEDEMFYLTARHRGVKMRFFPYVIATHPDTTTGSRVVTDAGVVKASGAVIIRQYPVSGLLRIPLKAWRMSRNGRAGFMFALRNLISGAVYSIFNVRI